MGPCEAVVLPVVWQCVEEAANAVQASEEEELCPEEQLEEYPEVRGLLLLNSAYLCSTSELSFLISIQNCFIHTVRFFEGSKIRSLKTLFVRGILNSEPTKHLLFSLTNS